MQTTQTPEGGVCKLFIPLMVLNAPSDATDGSSLIVYVVCSVYVVCVMCGVCVCVVSFYLMVTDSNLSPEYIGTTIGIYLDVHSAPHMQSDPSDT